MITKDNVKQQLQQLKQNQMLEINWSEGGGCEAHRVYDAYVLFLIPIYGGEPEYIETYILSDLDALVTKAYSFT